MKSQNSDTGNKSVSPAEITREDNDDVDLTLHLLPSESIVSVRHIKDRTQTSRLSGIKELIALTHSYNSQDIGRFGPAFAAKSVDVLNTPSELRLYEAVFGRDSLQVALELIDEYPRLTLSTLIYLAQYQGVERNTNSEEEPGRIPHEIRDPKSEVAQRLTAARQWGWPYYGSVDATPLFIQTFTAYSKNKINKDALYGQVYKDKTGEEHSMFYSFEQAVGWLTARLDQNAEGLLEFKSSLTNGIENQAWKDSWDSYSHADGSLANHKLGIASVEVQALAYDALLDAAELYELNLRENIATDLRRRAEVLRAQIFEIFWTNDKGGYFVLGTDRDDFGNLHQLKIRTSNMGHLLRSRILKGDDPVITSRREAVIRQLFSPEMLNVSGVRTLASDEARYKPGAYHNGSVWLWDTFYIAKGLREHGFDALATNLETRILNVIKATNFMPEFVRGDSSSIPTMNSRIVDVLDTQYNKINRIEQPPQEIQAWTVASFLSIKFRNGHSHYIHHADTVPKVLEQKILDGMH